ncbi:MAG: N-acetylglucosamine-6-phosphate deacetylase [Clostridiales bacterium]|nr:N-acetylglucosamine-6-phosphate deacetylase [Candidatus Coliplasma caballi]
MTKRIKFKGDLLFDDRIERGGEICVEDGVITYAGKAKNDNCLYEVRDYSGFYTAPGLIDGHQHGGGGHDYMDGTKEAFIGAATLHAKYGTTTILPTTLTCPDEELFESFETLRKVQKTDYPGAYLYGMHLEGPYFSADQKGAQDEKYLKKPTPEHYGKVLEAAKGLIVRWTVAPEIEGAMELGDTLKQAGILPCMGHSNATIDVAKEARYHGYSHLTHFYSGMSSIIRIGGYRYPGLIEAGYLYDDLTVEIIADGKHLPETLLQLVYRSKGDRKTVLVTDAMRGAGQTEGKTILGSLTNGQECFIEDGVAKMPDRKAFAGSVATADRLVRNMKELAGAGICSAVRMMTATPAELFGIKRRGFLREGYLADFAIFDENIHVTATVRGGETIYEEGKH